MREIRIIYTIKLVGYQKHEGSPLPEVCGSVPPDLSIVRSRASATLSKNTYCCNRVTCLISITASEAWLAQSRQSTRRSRSLQTASPDLLLRSWRQLLQLMHLRCHLLSLAWTHSSSIRTLHVMHSSELWSERPIVPSVRSNDISASFIASRSSNSSRN